MDCILGAGQRAVVTVVICILLDGGMLALVLFWPSPHDCVVWRAPSAPLLPLAVVMMLLLHTTGVLRSMDFGGNIDAGWMNDYGRWRCLCHGHHIGYHGYFIRTLWLGYIFCLVGGTSHGFGTLRW